MLLLPDQSGKLVRQYVIVNVKRDSKVTLTTYSQSCQISHVFCEPIKF